VFQYFASIKDGDEWFMTAQDFLRSIMPFSKLAPGSEIDVPPSFAYVMSIADPNGDGRISFAEYVFFTSLMSIPRKYFDIAFRVMDRNGDNQVDAEEFQRVMKVVQSRNPLQNAARTPVENGPLLPGWFGKGEHVDFSLHFAFDDCACPDGKKTLSLEDFKRFLNHLHGAVREVLFSSLDQDKDGFIDAQEFALSLVNFASVKVSKTEREREREA
jgi:Ca2+-binding EF-hand superfamily protein